MKKFLLLCLSMAALHGVQAQTKTHQIVFQFTNANDTMQQKAMIKQLQNLHAHWPEAKMEVVLYNQGLELLMPGRSIRLQEVRDLMKKGIRFVVCENTIKNRQIKPEELIPETEYVPAGIAEIVERQEQGWSYIKGGF